MSYSHLLPSMTEYAKKFGRLDSLDFKIVQAMLTHGIYNVRKLTRDVDAPQQTISYRIRRFDSNDLIRFRALIDEPKLGLKSYSVTASTQIGNEDKSGQALTCFPLWRYLALIDGSTLGNYVRYAIPQDKKRDLTTFLNELRKRKLISDYEIQETDPPNYPLLDLDFYASKQTTLSFNWENWAKDIDTYPKKTTETIANPKKAEFDLIDLIILRCLELNARTTQRRIVQETTRILREKDTRKFIPLVSRRIRKNINRQGLIRGHRVYLFPNQDYTVLLFMYYMEFTNKTNLEKLTTALNHLPYNTAYEKTQGKNAIFLRIVAPSFQYETMRKAIATLASQGYITDAQTHIGQLTKGTWDNVEIHQMFKDGAWNFSYGSALEMLENILTKSHAKRD